MRGSDLLRACIVSLFVTCVLLWLMLITGCGKGDSERNTGLEKGRAPKGAVTYEQGFAIAREWAGAIPGGSFGSVNPTGSMEPLIDSSVIPIYAPADGRILVVGQIVVSARDGKRILHQVAAINDTHFISVGISNARYDGWVPRSTVTQILVGQIYTKGANE